MTDKLARAVYNLQAAYKTTPLYKRRGMCLGMTRNALSLESVKLPWNAYPENTALGCFADLAANPAKYGWQVVHHPLPDYCLVFFAGCGRLKDGRIAGHIGILHDGVIYSDTPTPMTKWWGARLKGAFVLIGG